MNKDYRSKVVKALKSVVHNPVSISGPEEKPETQPKKRRIFDCCLDCCSIDCSCVYKSLPSSVKAQKLNLTPELKFARLQGLKLSRNLIVPAMPNSIKIIWVILEIVITLAQFIFSIITVQFDTNFAFNIVYLTLASLSLLLALIDTAFYFSQFKIVKRFFCCLCRRKNHNETSSKSSKEDDEDDENKKKNWKTSLQEWSELIRNFASELLLYPLIVCDLFELIVSGTYQLDSTVNQASFSFFIFGLFFLIISVYIARLLMIVLTIATLRRAPSDFSKTGKSYLNLITKFLIHVVFQVAVHIFIIVAIAIKIFQENPTPSSTVEISPTLWIAILTGWLIPFIGTFMFFLTNYYWVEEFTMGIYLELMSLLQETSFSESVFSGKETLNDVKSHCSTFFKEIKLIETKKAFSERAGIGTIVRLMYPLKSVIFYFAFPIYVGILVLFSTSLFLSVDTTGALRLSLFDGGAVGITLILSVIIICIANIQVVGIVVILLTVFLAIGVLLVLWIPLIIAFLIYSCLCKRDQ